MLQGDLWRALGQLRKAHTSYEAAVALTKLQPELSKEKWEEAFISQQSCLHVQGKNDKALAGLVPLLERRELSSRMLGLLHRTLGNTYSSAANWHQAKFHLTSTIETIKTCGDRVREAEWTAELGGSIAPQGFSRKPSLCRGLPTRQL